MYDKLREARKEKNITIVDLAEVIEKKPSTYAKKEREEIPFTVPEANKILDYLNVDASIFYTKNCIDTTKCN